MIRANTGKNSHTMVERTQNHTNDDLYLSDINDDRQNYPIEPKITETDELGNVNFTKIILII